MKSKSLLFLGGEITEMRFFIPFLSCFIGENKFNMKKFPGKVLKTTEDFLKMAKLRSV